MKEISINKEYINLGQFLKMTSIVNSGGEVKFYLDQNDVYINDILDLRRGRKLYHNDIISVNNDLFIIKNEIIED